MMEQSFLHNVAEDLIRRAGGIGMLKQYTLVFPMHRGGLGMRRELGELMKVANLRTIILPEMVTIDELADSLSKLRPDDELHSIIDLYHIYTAEIKESPTENAAMELDVFYGWGKQLLSDFSDIDMALLNADSLFANTIEAHELEDMPISEDTRDRLLKLLPKQLNGKTLDPESRRALFEQFWSLIPKLYHAIRSRHAQQGIGYRGARVRQVVDNWDSHEIQERIKGRRYAFIGFNYLLEGERRLMKLLQESHSTEEEYQTLFYWDYDPDFHTNPDAYKFITAELSQFPNALEENPSAINHKPSTILLASATGTSTQAQYVHDWLLRHHRTGDSTAVVIADENLLEPVVFALPAIRNEKTQKDEKYNITKGFPLRDTQIYGEVVRYLSDARMEKCANNEWSAILRRLLDTIAAELASTDTTTNRSWQETLRLESVHQVSLVLRRFITMLENGTLNDIKHLHTLRNLIRRCMDMVSMPFHGEPMVDLQVLGVLESRVLDFDHLLILNAEEGVLPKTPSNSSFIPYYLRKYHHMQTSDEESAIYAYNFFRLLRRCPDCTILFSSGATGTNCRSMSRFLMQMLISGEYPIRKIRLTESEDIQNRTLNVIDPRYPSYLAAKKAMAGENQLKLSLSPSAITTYLGCRRRFYLQYVLGLKDAQQEEPILSNADLGSLIHGILHSVYETIAEGKFPCRIMSDDIHNFINQKEKMSMALDSAYADLNENYAFHHPNDAHAGSHYRREDHPVENEVAIRYARKVLEHDAALPYLEIVLMEKKHYIDVPIDVPGEDAVAVSIGGIIDRLDIVEQDGSLRLRILDYKTGSFSPDRLHAKTWEELTATGTKKTYMLQTLIYCLICAKKQQILNSKGLPIMPSLLFTKQNLSDFDPRLFIADAPITDFAPSAESFATQLKTLIETIVNGTDFDMCSENECKSYCPFHALCGREKKEF